MCQAKLTPRPSWSGRKWLPPWLLPALLLAVGCGGNYSNTDVDFQLAVPAREDLTMELPRQALLVADSAEYFRLTHQVTTTLNAIGGAVIALVDHVRSYPPTRRAPELREWGPFPVEEDPTFEVRLRIQRRGGDAGRLFHYEIHFHRRGTAAEAWYPLVSGNYDPAGGVRRGQGDLVVDLAEARAQGYPVQAWGQLVRLETSYRRLEYPHLVEHTLINAPEAENPRATTRHLENADGSGEITFTVRPRDNFVVQALVVHTRFIASGAGRGDARVTEGFGALGGVLGTDCWGPDTRATYSKRDYGTAGQVGDPTSCVLGPATP